MIRKSVVAEFKTDKGKPGRFKALFSVAGNIDLDSDRIITGAFEEATKNDPHPAVVWTHQWDIPPIGETLDWGEVAATADSKGGAEAEANLFMDDHPIAKQVWKGLDTKALKQFSFAFDIGERRLVEPQGGEKSTRFDGMIQEILKIPRVFEWGPTLMGANPETMLTGKSLDVLMGLKELGIDLSNLKSGDISDEEIEEAADDLGEQGDPEHEKAVATLLASRPMLHLHS